MDKAIRVVIAHDHLLVREGLRMILSDSLDIQVVGEAEDGLQVIEMAAEICPEVILMSLRLPSLDGVTATEKIKAQWPQISIIILATYDDDHLLIRSLRAGAQGFLFRDAGRQTLVETIQAVGRGDILLQADIFNRLFQEITHSPRSSAPAYHKLETSAYPSLALSQREVEVLKLVAHGARNKEVAFQLNISQSTVKAHLDNIFNKLSVDSRTAAVSIASHYGLLKN